MMTSQKNRSQGNGKKELRLYQKMELIMKENGLLTLKSDKDEEHKSGLMALCTKDTGLMGKHPVAED